MFGALPSGPRSVAIGPRPTRALRRPARHALATLAGCAFAVAIPGPAAATAAAATVPAVTSIRPNNGPVAGGTPVSILGSDFTPGSTVAFGGQRATAVRVDSPTEITATSPAGGGTVDVAVRSAGGTSSPLAADQFAYDAPPSGPWLGLDGNNSTYLGDVRAFVEHDVVFDRSGPVEWTAGEGLSVHGPALEADLRNGMVPVVTIEYRGYDGRYRPDVAFPTDANGSRSLSEYVEGFVASATAIASAHRGARILFEPINEPWGYTTPEFTGGQYASVIAALLPAVRRAHLPVEDIYVGATGRHWVEQMYRARPSLQREVEGWYLHPYGPPSGSSEQDSRGIQSLPRVQAEMTSGQNNIIVSEIGFCALDVNAGHSCGFMRVAQSIEAAALLTQMLESAAAYHDAGWLKALLVYSRNDGGWAMQLPHGILTAQGEALEAFADSQRPGGVPGLEQPADAAVGIARPPLLLPLLTTSLLCSLRGSFVCDPDT